MCMTGAMLAKITTWESLKPTYGTFYPSGLHEHDRNHGIIDSAKVSHNGSNLDFKEKFMERSSLTMSLSLNKPKLNNFASSSMSF
jgi:hypothetical protein